MVAVGLSLLSCWDRGGVVAAVVLVLVVVVAVAVVMGCQRQRRPGHSLSEFEDTARI